MVKKVKEQSNIHCFLKKQDIDRYLYFQFCTSFEFHYTYEAEKVLLFFQNFRSADFDGLIGFEFKTFNLEVFVFLILLLFS